MIKKFLKLFGITFLILFPAISVAEEISKISQLEVTESAVKNYPSILSAYEKVNLEKGSFLSSQGFFDIKLKQSYQDNSRGFYDGKISDTLVEKELGLMGAKVYGGFRKSYGNFPDYEGYSKTNNSGEYRAGAKFSLLKDSSIDKERLTVSLAELGIEESKIQLERIKMEIERDATKAYWKWVTATRIYEIYENLYKLSITRQNQMEERLKKGDIAKIIVTENKKNILRRKSALAKARQESENSAIYLSLFWRDENGNPKIPQRNQAPKPEFVIKNISQDQLKNDLEIAMENRPEIKALKIKQQKASNELKYSKNLFKPQLDVDLGASQDQGNGLQSRSQTKNYIGAELTIPLQFREARGSILESESQIKSLKYEQQITLEKISAEVNQIRTKLDNIAEIHDNSNEEAILAELLEKSEVEKFKHGASNFFLVNFREQDTAASKATVFEAEQEYHEALADYKMAIFKN